MDIVRPRVPAVLTGPLRWERRDGRVRVRCRIHLCIILQHFCSTWTFRRTLRKKGIVKNVEKVVERQVQYPVERIVKQKDTVPVQNIDLKKSDLDRRRATCAPARSEDC